MTDVLGDCLSWADGECVVQPAAGPAVRIRVADIVSGKPVPPRPSVRGRVTPTQAQVRGGALFEDLVTEPSGPLGEWLLRRSDAHPARRANSVLAMAGSGSVDEVAGWYAARGRRPVAAVLPDSPQDDLFRSVGWVLEAELADTAFQMSGVAAASRAAGYPTAPVELVPLPGGLVRAGIGDRASGVASYDRDWVGFRAISVSEEHRRQGLGLAVMAALLEWGAEQGATTAYLQVTSDNAPALRLYEGLGFVTHHEYRYLTPAAGR